MSSRPSIVVQNLSKTYRINKEGNERNLPWQRNITSVEALKPVTFAAFKGESIGILGENGSGKSTLLSLIAGNEAPTTGQVRVAAQPSLLSVAAALQPHLSGHQNTRLGLLAQGLSSREVDDLIVPVASWADIGEAIDRPISTYSSGMTARLKFAIATAVRPEILLVDEALATGDASFTSRAQQRMNTFLKGASTVFIVSHSTGTIRQNCTRALWLHQGEVIADLPSHQAVKWYNMWAKKKSDGDRGGAAQVIRRMRKDYAAPSIQFRRDGSAAAGNDPAD